MIQLFDNKIKLLNSDYGEIHYEIITLNKIVYSNKNIEAVQTTKTASGNVRVYDRGGWGFTSFNELDLDHDIERAQKNARLVSSNLSRTMKPLLLNSKTHNLNLKTAYQISPSSYDLNQKNKIALDYQEMLKHPQIASSRVVYMDYHVEKFFVNTLGSSVKQDKTFTGLSASAMAKDGTNVQQAFVSVGQYGGMELVLGLEEKVEAAKKRAVDLLSAKKVDSGQYTVILDPNLAGVFAHEAFGHLSESDFLYDNPRMQDVMVIGRDFGPSILNILDDGSLENLAGYTPVDDEGVEAHKTYLIKEGKLHSRLHSRETAGAMQENITGNARAINPGYQPIVRMTNTYIDKGSQKVEDLIASVEDGIYAIDYLGGMTNLEMFTFSSGYAYRIKNGKLGELIKDVNLSGNVFSTLHNIEGIADDLEFHGGLGGCGKSGQGGLPVATGSPHIKIKNVLVGGV